MNAYHLLFIPLAVAMAGCASLDRYLDEHRSERATQAFDYVQIGRVEFYGPFDVAILQTNQAWPCGPEDARSIQESFAMAVAQPAVVNGALVYPVLPQARRSVRISHRVRGFADREPLPSWNGPVVHETTVVPWSGDENARYDNEYRYERGYRRRVDDRPDGRTRGDGPVGQ